MGTERILETNFEHLGTGPRLDFERDGSQTPAAWDYNVRNVGCSRLDHELIVRTCRLPRSFRVPISQLWRSNFDCLEGASCNLVSAIALSIRVVEFRILGMVLDLTCPTHQAVSACVTGVLQLIRQGLPKSRLPAAQNTS